MQRVLNDNLNNFASATIQHVKNLANVQASVLEFITPENQTFVFVVPFKNVITIELYVRVFAGIRL